MACFKKALRTPLAGSYTLFFIFLFFYLLYTPVFSSGLLYRDDYFRLFDQTLYWINDGRILSKLSLNILTLSDGAYLSPMPQLLAVVIMALTTLWAAHKIFGLITGFSLSLLSLVFLNPFYLQNMSYSYDSLPMTLASSAAILAAITLLQPIRFFALSLLCIGFILYSYQPALGLYVSMTIFVVVKHFIDHKLRFKARSLIKITLYLCSTLLILFAYKISFIKLFPSESGRAHFDYYHIAPNLYGLINDLRLIFYPNFATVLPVIVGFVLLALLANVLRVTQRPAKFIILWIWALGIISTAFGLILLNAAGPSVFLLPEPYTERLFIGASGIWLLTLYLISTLSKRLYTGFYIIFALLCFSFSYSYGAFLRFQDQHNAILMAHIHYDIMHNKILNENKHLVALNPLPLAPANHLLLKKTPLLANIYGEHHLLWLTNAMLFPASLYTELSTLPSIETVCTLKQTIQKNPLLFKSVHTPDYTLYTYQHITVVDFYTDTQIMDKCENWRTLFSLIKKHTPVSVKN